MNARARSLALFRFVGLGTAVGAVCGAASALFLVALDHATATRERMPMLVYALPFAGLAIGWVLERIGEPVRAGNDLVIDTIHDDGPEIPLRMAPIVLVGTVLTHLFGGSAGREGTAVQMGASLTDALAHRLGLDRATRRLLLCAGVAGGFGSVFGTPVAGAVFGMEFVVLGRLEHRALVPALVASVIGDLTTRALGVSHTSYPSAPAVALTPALLGIWCVFGVAVAATTVAFVELTHRLRALGTRWVPRLPLRMFVGGLVLVGMTLAIGTHDYLGLGVPTIVRAFEDPTLPAYTFAAKLLFTAVTIGAGYLGGEVTPLFFVGATLGAVLARFLGLPLPLGAGVGLAAVFAAASNTPLALSVMAVELLGAHVLPHVLIVAVIAYLLTGQRSIYRAQRVHATKSGEALPAPVRIGEFVRTPKRA